MEGIGDREKKLLISELMLGQQCAEQLRIHVRPFFPAELHESLVPNIISSFSRALAMLKSNNSEGEPQPTGLTTGTDSPDSFSGSPQSEYSDQTFKDQERRETSKKRKTLPKWTEQVRVCTGAGLEYPLDDGCRWRKYGQKDILGAKYPRGYYRCTHRNVQGCLATKHVQRSDEDPSIFDVTYRGKHTCFQSYHQINRNASSSPDKQLSQQQQQLLLQPQKLGQVQQPKEILLNFKTSLKVKTERLENRDLYSPPFSFPPTSIESVTPESRIFSPSNLDANNFIGSFSPPFMSPATSESNYFSVSPCRMHSVKGGPNMQTSESELTEIISASTSVTNSPLVDLDFNLEPVEFDPDFPFDASVFFS
ncbi:probable WRKY transcription factor 41 [Aristolochia californica]|uniref:probable WRKY transcription factor 41 n=1 Tax=Aristolochia californica TaxID=171875 RepID=UPI0035DA27C9